MSKNTKVVLRELESIAARNGGVLWPRKVVDAARPKSSPIHSRFEWNNGKAGERFRIWQARQLIAVTVNFIGESKYASQVWVSLKPDREESGGYRSIISVLTDSDLRKQLLADAFADMEIFEKKYNNLNELAHIFDEMHKAKKRKAARQ